jgi:hypothetical protein
MQNLPKMDNRRIVEHSLDVSGSIQPEVSVWSHFLTFSLKQLSISAISRQNPVIRKENRTMILSMTRRIEESRGKETNQIRK